MNGETATWRDRDGVEITGTASTATNPVHFRVATWKHGRTGRPVSAPVSPDGKSVLVVDTKYSATFMGMNASSEGPRYRHQPARGRTTHRKSVGIANQWQAEEGMRKSRVSKRAAGEGS